MNSNINHNDCTIYDIKEKVKRLSKKYINKLTYHLNHFAVVLQDNSNSTYKLPDRFKIIGNEHKNYFLVWYI